MALTIVDAGQVVRENTVLTLYAPPNLGKTTLALTAERPIHLDFDDGIQRAAPEVRSGKAHVTVNSWDDIAGFEASDFANYKTVVIDTVGTCIDKLMLAINSSGKLKVQEWGDLGARFKAMVNRLRSFGLDVVFVAHGSEEQRGDVTVDRIQAAGNMAKQLVYQASDFIGRLYLDEQNRRCITFNPTNTSFAKNVGTGLPTVLLPKPEPGMDTLARLIAQGKHLLNQSSREEQHAAAEQMQAVQQFQAFTAVEQFNEAVKQHATSSRVTKDMLVKIGESKGLVFNRETRTFSNPNAAPVPEPAPAAPVAEQPAPLLAPEQLSQMSTEQVQQAAEAAAPVQEQAQAQAAEVVDDGEDPF